VSVITGPSDKTYRIQLDQQQATATRPTAFGPLPGDLARLAGCHGYETRGVPIVLAITSAIPHAIVSFRLPPVPRGIPDDYDDSRCAKASCSDDDIPVSSVVKPGDVSFAFSVVRCSARLDPFLLTLTLQSFIVRTYFQARHPPKSTPSTIFNLTLTS